MHNEEYRKTVGILGASGERFRAKLETRATLLAAIADAYRRMATNRDPQYRKEQTEKVHAWLEELTQLFESEPQLWGER